MCEVPLYIDQFKNMASLDYAEIANNLSREVMVLFIEMPEAREQIFAIKDAAQCVQQSVSEAQSESEGTEGSEQPPEESTATSEEQP